MHFLILFLCVQLVQFSLTCPPAYVPDAERQDIRDEEILANFIPADIDYDILAAKRVDHRYCGCGVQERKITKEDLDISNVAKVDHVSEYPWQVLITFTDSDKKCAGTIINDLFILTNAQCFIGLHDQLSLVDVWLATKPETLPVDKVRIYKGVKNPYADNVEKATTEYYEADDDQPKAPAPPVPPKVVPVPVDTRKELPLAEKIIIHPNFTLTYFMDRTVDYDFALIKLKEKLDLLTHTPICLPTGPMPYEDKDAIITGWGYEIDHVPGAPKFYGKHDLRHFSHLDNYFRIDNSSCLLFANIKRMRCMKGIKPYVGEAGYGGPLMIKKDESNASLGPQRQRVYQVGIISYLRTTTLDLVTITSAILRFVDYFSKKEGATWCSSTKGSKPYFPWDSVLKSTRDESLDCDCGIAIKEVDDTGNIKRGRVQGSLNLTTIHDSHPWMILLSARDFRFGELPFNTTSGAKDNVICTGTLINDKLILTSAECLFRQEDDWDGVKFKFNLDKNDIPTVDYLVAYEDTIDSYYMFSLTQFYSEQLYDNKGDIIDEEAELFKSPYRRLNISNAYFYPDFIYKKVSPFAETYLDDGIVLLELRTPITFPLKKDTKNPKKKWRYHNLICLPKIEEDYPGGLENYLLEQGNLETQLLELLGYGKVDFREHLSRVAEDEEYDASFGVEKLAKWFPEWVDLTDYSDFRLKNPGFRKTLQHGNVTMENLAYCASFTKSTISSKFVCSKGSTRIGTREYVQKYRNKVEKDATRTKSRNDVLYLGVTPLVGDEGAPLMFTKIEINNPSQIYKWTQIGMAAYSMTEVETNRHSFTGQLELTDIGRSDFPALYLKIQDYISFIEFVSNAVDAKYCKQTPP